MSDKEIMDAAAILASLRPDYQNVMLALLRECEQLTLQDADNQNQVGHTV